MLRRCDLAFRLLLDRSLGRGKSHAGERRQRFPATVGADNVGSSGRSRRLTDAPHSLPDSHMLSRSPRSAIGASCLLATALLTTACVAPPMAMAPTARTAIHTVRVNPVVQLPADMLYRGRAEGAAMMLSGPLLGAQVGSAVGKDTATQLVAEMRANHIDLGEIVAAEFAMQASSGSPITFVVGSTPADAQVDLTVNAYGISHAHALGTTLYPVVSLTATMKAPDGTVIWQANHVASAQNAENQEGHELEDYLRDPELLRRAFVTGSDIVSRVMVQDLVSVPKSRPGHLDSSAPGMTNAMANR